MKITTRSAVSVLSAVLYFSGNALARPITLNYHIGQVDPYNPGGLCQDVREQCAGSPEVFCPTCAGEKYANKQFYPGSG
jgi:hypothetical protein